MDIRKAKLIHSVKCNQFYTVMRIDEDVGTIYLQPTKNRHKDITKSQIAHIEDNPEFEYVVMHDATTTAEQHFLKIMDSDCSIHVKENEVKDFKKNMLMESECAMQILKALSEVDSNDKLYKLARDKYFRLTNRQTIEENRKTYIGQVVPDEIKRLAWTKRLFIERSDDYCGKPKHIATNLERTTTQGRHPCGFLIRDKGGIVVAGGRYEMSIPEVIDFVNQYKYVEGKHYGHLYYLPLTNAEKKQIKMCARILERNNLQYKSENNSYFWVTDKDKNIIAGSKNGFSLNGFVRFCKKLSHKQNEPKNLCVIDNV